MRLSQAANQEAQNPTQEKNKYPKNFSTLPTKTGATFKDSYKDRIKKDKDDKEDSDKPSSNYK